MTGSPFVWEGNQALTYEELEALAKRKRQAQIDTSPVKHWTQGAARVANALFGAIGDARNQSAFADAQKADQGLLSGALSLPPITGGPVPGEPVPGVPSTGARAMTLPPEAQEPGAQQTASLIQNFEGYRSKPYWDVNAYRVGFGSDTITDPATGEVRKVQKNDVINPEMATADLQRRIPEFQAKVAEKVPAFATLPDAIKAPLTSVAYNYGHLPGSVAKAVETGDPISIAQAVRSLASHNGGVNARRRATEAGLIERLAGSEGGAVRGGTGGDTLAPPVAMNDEEAAALEAQMGGEMTPPVAVANTDAEAAALEAQMGGGMVVPPPAAASLVTDPNAMGVPAQAIVPPVAPAPVPQQGGMPKLAPPVLAPPIPGENALPPGLQGLPQTAPLPPVRPEGLGGPVPVQPGPGSAAPPPAVARVAAALGGGGAPVPGSPAYEAMSNPDLSPSAVAALSSANRDATLANLVASSPQAQPVPASANYASLTGRSGAPAPLPERVNVPVAPAAAAPAAPTTGPATAVPPPAAAIPGNAPPSVQRVAQAAQQAMPPELLRAMTDPRSSPATKAVAGAIYRQRAEEIQLQQRQIFETLSKREQRDWEMKKIQEERDWKAKNETEWASDRYGRLYNKKTGEFKGQQSGGESAPIFRGLTDPAERAKFGIPAEDKTPYQVTPDGQLHAPPKGTNVNVDSGGTAKQIYETMEKSTASAQAAAQGLGAIRQAREAIQGGAVLGAGADLRLGLKKVGALLGADSAAIENTETFRSAIAPQVAAMLKATVGSANISDSDRRFAEKAAGGNITLDPGSIAKLLDIMERGNGAILEGHRARLDAVYPDNGQYTRERALFLPVAAPPPVPAAVPATSPAAAPEASKVIDGKTYVKRGGQWYEGP